MQTEAVADWLLELSGVPASPCEHLGVTLVLTDSQLVSILYRAWDLEPTPCAFQLSLTTSCFVTLDIVTLLRLNFHNVKGGENDTGCYEELSL